VRVNKLQVVNGPDAFHHARRPTHGRAYPQLARIARPLWRGLFARRFTLGSVCWSPPGSFASVAGPSVESGKTTGRSEQRNHAAAYRTFSEAAWNWDEVCRLLLLRVLDCCRASASGRSSMTRSPINEVPRLPSRHLPRCRAEHEKSTRSFALAITGLMLGIRHRTVVSPEPLLLSANPVAGLRKAREQIQEGAPHQEPTAAEMVAGTGGVASAAEKI